MEKLTSFSDFAVDVHSQWLLQWRLLVTVRCSYPQPCPGAWNCNQISPSIRALWSGEFVTYLVPILSGSLLPSNQIPSYREFAFPGIRGLRASSLQKWSSLERNSFNSNVDSFAKGNRCSVRWSRIEPDLCAEYKPGRLKFARFNWIINLNINSASTKSHLVPTIGHRHMQSMDRLHIAGYWRLQAEYCLLNTIHWTESIPTIHTVHRMGAKTPATCHWSVPRSPESAYKEERVVANGQKKVTAVLYCSRLRASRQLGQPALQVLFDK